MKSIKLHTYYVYCYIHKWIFDEYMHTYLHICVCLHEYVCLFVQHKKNIYIFIYKYHVWIVFRIRLLLKFFLCFEFFYVTAYFGYVWTSECVCSYIRSHKPSCITINSYALLNKRVWHLKHTFRQWSISSCKPLDIQSWRIDWGFKMCRRCADFSK